MDPKKVFTYVDSVWEESILPALKDYITIPNVSPTSLRSSTRSGRATASWTGRWSWRPTG